MTVGAGTECGVLRDNSLDVYGADGETPMAGREFEVIECQPDALAVRCHDLMREQANRLPSMCQSTCFVTTGILWVIYVLSLHFLEQLLMIYMEITLTSFARRHFCAASTIDFGWGLIEAFCPACNAREQPMT
jgi:hypothetical protein